jgi:hypothetical protein
VNLKNTGAAEAVRVPYPRLRQHREQIQATIDRLVGMECGQGGGWNPCLRKKLERLRSFVLLCKKRSWLTEEITEDFEAPQGAAVLDRHDRRLLLPASGEAVKPSAFVS